MDAFVAPILKFLYEMLGPGFVVALMACVVTGWSAVKAKTVLDGVATGLTKMAAAQEETNKIMVGQQRLWRSHEESQETLIDSMRSLVNEVHMATTSGNRMQETNMKAVLELLERQMGRSVSPTSGKD